ncbi:MAG: HEPN domain-containing protein [Armatimonadetes bacterium]|nr:HEPN domain-containing protein [Armatimonadota bacterium]
MASAVQVKDPVARKFFEEKLEQIQRAFAPDHMILFGSRAAGNAREDSDIDLILVSKRFAGTGFLERMAEFRRAVRPDEDVEAFCYTPEEFEEMTRRVGVIADAAREGIWLLGRRRLPRLRRGNSMVMAKQVKQWLEQADLDLTAAANLLEDGPYPHSALFSQQAAEKALKALYIFVRGQTPPRTHDVGKLASDLGAPAALAAAAEPMLEDYIASRYPDATPATDTAYTRQLAQSRLNDARAIMDWVRGQIGSK